MEVMSVREGYELWRPNREKAQSKSTKAVVALVMIASAVLIAIIVIGGWERMQSPMVSIMSLAWAGLYVFFALLVLNWNRGVLPVGSALAVIMIIFAAVAAPGWFDRSKDGLNSPILPEDVVGFLIVVLIPVQILMVIVAMIGFNQEWQVEEERPIEGRRLAGEDDDEDEDDSK